MATKNDLARISDWESGIGGLYSIRDIDSPELIMRAVEVDGSLQLQTSRGCTMSYEEGLRFYEVMKYLKGKNATKEQALEYVGRVYGTHIPGVEYNGNTLDWLINEVQTTGDAIINDHKLSFSTMEKLANYTNQNNAR